MNGLQSLMQGAPRQPQPQQAPAMPNDPRMGAAMSVVDDSVEKFNLDPQTEALMLQNQALGLLQAADNVGKMNAPQQDASIQEQTTQGIAGMLQSLAPGMQQRGRQVQSAQARKMLGGGAPARPAPARPPMGGMPSMGAPNMQRMADGGIVGYAEGGDVQQQDPMQAQLERFMQLQKLYEARQAAGATEEELTRIQEDIDSYSRVNSPGYNIEVEAAKARGEYDTPNGMADGGSVLFDEMGVSSDSPQFNVMSETLTNYPTMGPPEKEEPDEKSPKREANFLDKIQSFIAENVIDPDLSRRQFDMRGSGSAMRGRLSDRQKLLAGLLNNKVERGEMTREEALDAILGPKESGMARGGIIGYQDGGGVELDEELIAAMLAQNAQATAPVYDSAEERRARLQRMETVTRAKNANDNAEYNLKTRLANQYPELTREDLNRYVEAQNAKRLDTVSNLDGLGSLRAKPFRMQGVDKNTTPEFRMPGAGDGRLKATQFMPEGSSVMGLAGSPTTSETVLNQIMGLEMPDIDVDAAPKSSLRQPVIDAAMSGVGVDSDAAKRAEEDRVRGLAEAAYAMSPEMKAAYAAAKAKEDEYYDAQLDPKRLRSKKLDELIAGFAMPGGIRTSGIAALKGTTGVDDAALEMRRQRGVEDFARTKEQEDVGREARTKGFEAGSAAGQSVYERSMAARNQAMQSLSQLATSEETGAREIAFKEFERSMKALGNQLNFYLQKEKLNADERVTAQRVISDARTTITRTNNTIADLEAQKLGINEAGRQRVDVLISGLREQLSTAQGEINQLLPKVGVTPGQRSSSASTSGAMDAADYFK